MGDVHCVCCLGGRLAPCRDPGCEHDDCCAGHEVCPGVPDLAAELAALRSELTLDEYQRVSARTAPMLSEPLHTPELKEALSLAGLGVAGEAGEVADLCKKIVHHAKPLTPEVEAKLLAEAGDVLWYLAFLASALRVRLSHVARMNVEKLRKRYPDGWDTERANAPREGDEAGAAAVEAALRGKP